MTKVGRIVADTEHDISSDFVAFLDADVKNSKDYVNQYGELANNTVFLLVVADCKLRSVKSSDPRCG